VKFLLVLALLIGAAWYYYRPPAPGKGPEAELAMKSMAPVIAALENFKAAHQMYPRDLDELVPEFLGRRTMKGGQEPEYVRIAQNYKLSINYTNPLPVHCSYEPAKKWVCEWF
jgi:hypothetical protein